VEVGAAVHRQGCLIPARATCLIPVLPSSTGVGLATRCGFQKREEGTVMHTADWIGTGALILVVALITAGTLLALKDMSR
jgi:hypothetical protein